MFCTKCGNIIPDNAKFCTACGAPVEKGTRVNAECDHPHEGTYTGYEAYPNYNVPAVSAPQVSIFDAIKLFFARYADFSGRSRRSEYWWAVLFVGIVSGILNAISGDSTALTTIWSLATLIPSLSIAVRRLHDAGKSGWWYLWNLLPIAGQIVLLIQYTKDSEPANQWGPNPKG